MLCLKCKAPLKILDSMPSERRAKCTGCGLDYIWESWVEDSYGDKKTTPATQESSEMLDPRLRQCRLPGR